METLIDKIHLEINNSIHAHYERPDFIMIHPVNKDQLKLEVDAKMCLNYDPKLNRVKIFGILITWTSDIGENEIIPTYK